MDQRQRVTALGRVPILAVLPENKLEILAHDCKWWTYEASQQILNYHDPSSEVFFLASGKVRVIVYSREGKAVVFTDLRPGAMFGEIAAIDRGPRSAGVEAIEASMIASLTASQFEVPLASRAGRLARNDPACHGRGAAPFRADCGV